MSADAGLERVGDVLGLTPLRGLAEKHDVLNSYPHITRRLEFVPEEHHSERNQDFANGVEMALKCGVVSIQRGWWGGYRIKFPDTMLSGTGAEAAFLVASVLKENGIDARAAGRNVAFSPKKLDAASISLFNSAVKSSAEERRALLQGNG